MVPSQASAARLRTTQVVHHDRRHGADDQKKNPEDGIEKRVHDRDLALELTTKVSFHSSIIPLFHIKSGGRLWLRLGKFHIADDLHKRRAVISQGITNRLLE